MAERKTKKWVGLISFWLFFILEITTDIWFGSKIPGYHWQKDSMSSLGQIGSPFQHLVTIWGVLFSILMSLFAIAFYKTYEPNRWAKIAALSLLIFGLGEGLGSGCFPIGPPDSVMTLSGKLHNLFSGIGDIGIISLPFWLMRLFPRISNRKLHLYVWFVVFAGIVMVSFFLIAKYYPYNKFITDHRGVWQRIYIFNYYIMLFVISLKMVFNESKNNKVLFSD